jgi:glycosyltransferase involved in cell wall biosynthesis
MQHVPCTLMICGDGNFMEQAIQLVIKYHMEEKVLFKGKVRPDELRAITQQAFLGITLFEDSSLSNYYSLANRFFDYMQAGIPQLCVDYPVYHEINEADPFALLIKDISVKNIALQLNNLLNDGTLYDTLQQNCLKARTIFNWQQEEKKLLTFYQELFLNNDR